MGDNNKIIWKQAVLVSYNPSLALETVATDGGFNGLAFEAGGGLKADDMAFLWGASFERPKFDPKLNGAIGSEGDSYQQNLFGVFSRRETYSPFGELKDGEPIHLGWLRFSERRALFGFRPEAKENIPLVGFASSSDIVGAFSYLGSDVFGRLAAFYERSSVYQAVPDSEAGRYAGSPEELKLGLSLSLVFADGKSDRVRQAPVTMPEMVDGVVRDIFEISQLAVKYGIYQRLVDGGSSLIADTTGQTAEAVSPLTAGLPLFSFVGTIGNASGVSDFAKECHRLDAGGSSLCYVRGAMHAAAGAGFLLAGDGMLEDAVVQVAKGVSGLLTTAKSFGPGKQFGVELALAAVSQVGGALGGIKGLARGAAAYLASVVRDPDRNGGGKFIRGKEKGFGADGIVKGSGGGTISYLERSYIDENYGAEFEAAIPYDSEIVKHAAPTGFATGDGNDDVAGSPLLLRGGVFAQRKAGPIVFRAGVHLGQQYSPTDAFLAGCSAGIGVEIPVGEKYSFNFGGRALYERVVPSDGDGENRFVAGGFVTVSR